MDNLNKSELTTFNWLIANKIPKDHIVHQKKNKIPNFILKDGRGFIVKKIYGKSTIYFGSLQAESLKKEENLFIVACDDYSNVPLAVIKADKLQDGEIREGFLIKILENQEPSTIEVNENTIIKLNDLKYSFQCRDYDELFEKMISIINTFASSMELAKIEKDMNTLEQNGKTNPNSPKQEYT